MTAWNAERWHAATAEVDQLIGRTAAEREAALATLRARDRALADDVARLLADHDAVHRDGFLEGGAADGFGPTVAALDSAAVGPMAPTLPPGTAFGAYIVRGVLGRGGMGIVYDAEEAASGRRVALKVLQHRLGDAHERERFEREGRLAASIDHEHCVFVFAATEVGGVPAIAMEPMQGTLADRLAADGPMAPAAAVDTALQLVAGLEAASRAGILHRDVKPSNCFVDATGAVKIGDFGISRSTRPADETALSTHGRLAATPTYASPEQLRGAALDIRADIYSLGATLYELVTGRRPFTAPDLMSLLMAVANDPPVPPYAIAPAVPRGLGQVILRCLAKRPDDRFADYAALAAALAPYASTSPTPATVGLRFTAGAIDQSALGLLVAPATVLLLIPHLPTPGVGVLLAHSAIAYVLLVAYYGTCEAFWQRTIGKAIVGLVVVDVAGRPPERATAYLRAAAFGGVLALQGLLLTLTLSTRPNLAGLVSAISQMLTLGVLFSTARRRNGYAALHDLVTRTRVVQGRARHVPSGAAAAGATVEASAPSGERRGAFAILTGAGPFPGWRLGTDVRLRRTVWIRDVAPGTPPVSAARAAISRPARLRWLAGERTASEAWDAYDGGAGRTLTEACRTPRRWSDARRWLLDLAQELAVAGDHPLLRIDRVWILDAGRARLLDDPASDPPASGADRDAAAIALLRDVARIARAASPEPWPPSAQRVIARLDTPAPPPLRELVGELDAAGRRRSHVTRGWRALSIAIQAAFPALTGAMVVVAAALLFATMKTQPLSVRVTTEGLERLLRAERGTEPIAPAERQAIESFLARQQRATLADTRLYRPEAFTGLQPAHRALADRILATPPRIDEEAVARSAEVTAILERARQPPRTPPVAVLGVMIVFAMLVVAALVSLLTTAAFRGATARLLGFDVVTRDGVAASRLRLLARWAIAWSPLLLVVLGSQWPGYHAPGVFVLAISLAVLAQAGGAIHAMLRPSRGLQDRLAGTWIVPR